MALDDLKPTVEEVAAHIRARTRVPGGTEAGTFNEQTRPTQEQAEAIIATSARTVANLIGTDAPCNDELTDQSKGVVALRAAMAIEASYYPEQTATGRSNFAQLRDLYKEDLSGLQDAIRDTCGGTAGDGEGGGGQLPTATFDDEILIGRLTIL